MLEILENKIDFVIIVAVDNANPNGDPSFENAPRTTLDGLGEIGAECVKRKIRNRLQDEGETIFIQSEERRGFDGYKSLKERFEALVKNTDLDREGKKQLLLNTYTDTRAFGAVVAFGSDSGKKKSEETNDSVSIGIRGPVTIRETLSVCPVEIVELGITKSVNGEPTEDGKKDASTMGKRQFVRHGIYVIKGSINPLMCGNTGFTKEDAEKIKNSLETLFVNDASAARPEGSITILKTLWFEHEGSQIGYAPTQMVHGSVIINKKEDVIVPGSYRDYDYVLDTSVLEKNPQIVCSESGPIDIRKI